MAFWYNNTPNFANMFPAAALYSYGKRLPGEPRGEGRSGDLRVEVIKSNPYQAENQGQMRHKVETWHSFHAGVS